MIEVLTRLRLPIAPVLPDEVARLADVGGRAHFDDNPPANPIRGDLWIKLNGEMAVWTGTQWLVTGGPVAGAITPDWNSDATWNDPRFIWS